MPPISLPIPDDALLSMVTWLYLVTNAARVFSFLPQIHAVWRCTDGAHAISLLTWGSWVLSHVSALWYGVLVMHDLPFVVIALINLSGCSAVMAITMRRRAQWRQAGRATALACASPGRPKVLSTEARSAKVPQ